MKIQTLRLPSGRCNKRKKNASRKVRKNGKIPPKKSPGGKTRHVGISRRHNPVKIITHISKKRICRYRTLMEYSHTETRDILDYILAKAVETRHEIEILACPNCNNTYGDENDLPRTGIVRQNIVAFVAQCRAERLPMHVIPYMVKAVYVITLAVYTVSNMLVNIADVMKNDVKSITNEVTRSSHVNIDETSYSLDGDLVWIWNIDA